MGFPRVRAQSYRTIPASHTNYMSRLPPVLMANSYTSEVLTTPSSSLINLLEQLTELRETLMLTSILRDTLKDTNQQPDQKIHRIRSGRVLNAGASVLVKLGPVTLPVCECFPTWKLPNPHTFGVYRGLIM